MPSTAPPTAPGPARGWADYERRLDRVTRHIYEHLAEPLDLDGLAQVAHLSPYHWHRVYHAMRGETIAATIQRLRLQSAARLLAQTQLPVDQVAQRCGYASAASFTRVFKQSHGMAPAQWRTRGSHAAFAVAPQGQPGRSDPAVDEQPGALVVRVCEQAALPLATVAHGGPYINIGQAFERLYSQLARHNLFTPQTRSLGVYFDDPAAVSPSSLRSCAGASVAPGVVVPAPLQSLQLQAGRYAVLRYQGPYSAMHAAYRWLFGQWLPQSGHAPANAPVFEDYLNNPKDVSPLELLTDIYLPLL